MSHPIVTLPNIDEIEAGFNRSFDLYVAAFEKIAEADAAIKAAMAEIETVTPGASFHHERDAREVHEFHAAVALPDRKTYLAVARKLLNLRCWHYVVDRCGIQQLMDTQAKRELDAQLRYVTERSRHDRELIDDEEMAKGPPPFTAENVRATINRLAGDAGMIWRRGIANVFSGLDRRFRSHDGFKVGSRIILTRLLDDSGCMRLHDSQAEQFRDVERTFHILDGRDPRHAQSRFLHQIKEERDRMGIRFKRGQSVHEGEFFRVRVFQNGNAHLWFTRDDLVEKVNRELAAYYGEVIGDGQTKEPDPLESRALTPARMFGFFPTPPALAERIVSNAVPYCKTPRRILEPSAGTGNLAFAAGKVREIVTRDGWDEKTDKRVRDVKLVRDRVDAIEIQAKLAADLRASGKLASVTTADFLQVPARPDYDGVIMNPPFDRERDIDHVTHALKFLKPGGWLLAIMSAGVEFRETRKATAFRKLLDERKGWIVDLPPGSFADVGTHVNTVLVGIGLSRRHHF